LLLTHAVVGFAWSGSTLRLFIMSSSCVSACQLQDLLRPNDLVVDVKSLDEQVTDGHGPHQSRARRKSYIAKRQLTIPPSFFVMCAGFRDPRVYTVLLPNHGPSV
jgi:hypothetical protein